MLFSRVMNELPFAGYRSPGFTVIEVLVAIAIVVVAMAIALPSYSSYRERALVAQAITDIGASGKLDPWGNPYQYTDLTTAGISKARKNKNLVPINSEYDLYSMGKDGLSKLPLTVPVSRDDVILANDGRFIGLASKYE